MKISQETPDILVIEKRTSLWYFIGLMLALVGVIILLISIISFTITFDRELIVPSILILIGFIIIAFNKQISITFDKKTNRISYIEERMIGSLSEYRQLNKIQAVELREATTGKKPKISYIIALVFKDLPELEIKPSRFSFSFLFLTFFSVKKTEEIANRISEFLGIKLVKKTPSLPEKTPAEKPRFPVLPVLPAKAKIEEKPKEEPIKEKEEVKEEVEAKPEEKLKETEEEKEKLARLDEEEKTEL